MILECPFWWENKHRLDNVHFWYNTNFMKQTENKNKPFFNLCVNSIQDELCNDIYWTEYYGLVTKEKVYCLNVDYQYSIDTHK